mmetsp:Transcript_4959/g.10874  ORF Transcript_4959/g.10874 Transcript_4959/m.10874 type:complete len:205 (-) Transcript_4959:1074-1688(-)
MHNIVRSKQLQNAETFTQKSPQCPPILLHGSVVLEVTDAIDPLSPVKLPFDFKRTLSQTGAPKIHDQPKIPLRFQVVQNSGYMVHARVGLGARRGSSTRLEKGPSMIDLTANAFHVGSVGSCGALCRLLNCNTAPIGRCRSPDYGAAPLPQELLALVPREKPVPVLHQNSIGAGGLAHSFDSRTRTTKAVALPLWLPAHSSELP